MSELESSNAETNQDLDPMDALWAEVIAGWDEDKHHHKVLEYAIRTQRMPELAGRYKTVTTDPDRAERAKKKLDGVVIAATHMLISMKTPARTKTPWQWNAVIIAMCLLVLGFLGLKFAGYRR